MGSWDAVFGYALVVGLCVLLALVVIFLCRRDLLWRAVGNLATTYVPLAFALVLWPFIRWPSPYVSDQIMLASVFVLVPLGVVAFVLFIVRSRFFR
jgi:hypothetical protein